MKKNLCVWCGSASYGPGCPYSPHGIHFHPGDPKRCVWCGSYAVGPGCPFNPIGKNHIHGIDFNQMIRDSVEQSITASYLIHKLSQPIQETQAYKLGLVNEHGHKLKNPLTNEEKNAYTSLDSYIFNLKQLLGSKIELLNNTLFLEKQEKINLCDYTQLYENEIKIRKKFKQLAESFHKIISEGYQTGLSTITIEKLILETFTNSKN